MSTRSLIILNNIVNWHLTSLDSSDSHSKCSNMEVTLLALWSVCILNNIVNWHLTSLDSSDSHSKCSNMEVTLLALWSVCNIPSRSMLNHFKLVDVVLGVGVPDCATVPQYGSDERERYVAVFGDSLLAFKCRLRKPIILFPFFMVWSICLFQAMFVCILTPRYRVESSDVRTCPFNEYSLTTGFLDLDTLMVLHLSGWKGIRHFFSHDASLHM